MAAGIVAVAMGLVAMALGGAPRTYLAVNGGAVIVGLVIAFALSFAPLHWRWPSLAAALALLATAIWGAELDGIHRWVIVGPLRLQPTFILLPLLLCSYARNPDSALIGASMVIAAVAVMLQPDRSMAFALAIGAVAVAFAIRNRLAVIVAIAAFAALVIALTRDDHLPPVRFVEEVIVDGLLRGGPLVGGLILIGIAALIAPILLSGRLALPQQRGLIAFVLVWSSLLIASTMGHYPTPLLGYGASAIIGYFIAIVTLRPEK